MYFNPLEDFHYDPNYIDNQYLLGELNTNPFEKSEPEEYPEKDKSDEAIKNRMTQAKVNELERTIDNLIVIINNTQVKLEIQQNEKLEAKRTLENQDQRIKQLESKIDEILNKPKKSKSKLLNAFDMLNRPDPQAHLHKDFRKRKRKR